MNNLKATYEQLAEQRYRLLDITSLNRESLTKKQVVAVEKAESLLREVEDWMKALKGVVKIDN